MAVAAVTGVAVSLGSNLATSTTGLFYQRLLGEALYNQFKQQYINRLFDLLAKLENILPSDYKQKLEKVNISIGSIVNAYDDWLRAQMIGSLQDIYYSSIINMFDALINIAWLKGPLALIEDDMDNIFPTRELSIAYLLKGLDVSGLSEFELVQTLKDSGMKDREISKALKIYRALKFTQNTKYHYDFLETYNNIILRDIIDNERNKIQALIDEVRSDIENTRINKREFELKLKDLKDNISELRKTLNNLNNLLKKAISEISRIDKSLKDIDFRILKLEAKKTFSVERY